MSSNVIDCSKLLWILFYNIHKILQISFVNKYLSSITLFISNTVSYYRNYYWIIANNTKISVGINFIPFNRRFNKHPTSRVYRDPFCRKCTLRRRPFASWLRGVLLASEAFFVTIFMARDQEWTAGRSRILLGRWTVKILRFTSHWAIMSLNDLGEVW